MKVTPKVRIVACEGKLVFIPNKPEQGIGNDWWPVNQKGNMGSVLGDSATMLGVSRKALEIMRTIPRNRDAIGDLGWWTCHNGKVAFSWFGVLYRIMDPKESEAARDFKVYESKCILIPNRVPTEAVAAVQANQFYWREPLTT